MENDVSKVLALANMGFSEEQIKTIMSISVQPSGLESAAEAQQVMLKEEPSTAVSEEKTATAPTQTANNERLNSLEQAIKDLTKATHKAAIQASSMPEQKEMTILDVMNDLCR